MSNTEALRAAAAAALCACKDRPAADCPGEWDPGCDLGANPAHVRVAQPAASGEPVAWTYMGIKADGVEHGPHLVWKPAYMDAMSASKGAKATPLYAAPQQAAPAQPLTDSPWVQRQTPFTDSQIDAILDHAGVAELPPEWHRCDYEIARAIEAAHGITAKEAP